TALAREYVGDYPAEAARVIETLPSEQIAAVLERESAPRAVALLERLLPDVGAEALQHRPPDAARELLASLTPERAALLLSRMDKEIQAEFLRPLDAWLVNELQTLMTYPPGTAGSLMDPRVTLARREDTVAETLSAVQAAGRKRIYDICVVDDRGHLVGTVALQDLVLAESGERLEEHLRFAPATVDAMATREEVVDLMTQYRLPGLPVVDAEERVVGIIRHDRLIAAAQEEASVDIQTMVGASKEERALSSISFAIRKRLPWLEINLVTAFIAASVVGIFEGIIAKFTALAVLLPVVAGQSGNTGAQALAVTMRGLALREIRPRHWLRIAFKEANVAFFNGIAVALTTSLGVYIWSRSIGLALVIGFSMIVSMIVAGLSGALIPMILLALGQDPAQSSSIILTTVTDVVGFFSFLGLATLLAAMLPT
ncbi:MAG TPA: magnesium transporter, partial [Candidatus Limnocylindria bacterium]|nr:magnesium transporter [Candidatus Limnocylindria bacterium]